MADLTISVDIDAKGTKAGADVAKSAIKGIKESVAGIDWKGLGDRMKAAGAMMQQFGGQLRQVGTTMTIGLTTPIVAAGAAVLKAGADYEKALNIFQAVTKANTGEMERAAKVAKDLGADLTLPATSAKDAALAMNELGKAGLTATQSIDAAKGVLQLAAAGALDEARAAEIAANALNAFKLEAADTTRVANLLAASANASSAEVDDIALSLQQASAVFAAAKIPIEDLVTAIGVMANAGVKGQDAGTSLKQFLLSLEAPTKAASAVMKQLGVDVFDTTGKMRDLPDIIGQFQQAMAGMTDEQTAAALQKIFGSDAIRAAQILFNTGTEGFAKMKEAVTANGAAAELANARMKGLAGAWEGFKSQLETVGITLYEVIKTPLTDFLRSSAEWAGKLGDYFATLSPGVQQAAIAFVAFVAALGPVLVIAGSLISALGTIVSAFGAIASAIGAAGGIATLAPIIAILVAGMAELAAVAAVVYAAWTTNFGGIRDLTQMVADFVVSAWNASLAALKDLTQSLLAEVQKFWAENGEQIMQGVKNASDTIKAVWTTVANFWKENSETIKEVTRIVWGAIKEIIVGALRIFLDVIGAFLSTLKGDWQGAWDKIKDILKVAWDAILAVARASGALLIGAIKLVFQAIWDLNAWVFEEAGKLARQIGEGLARGLIAMKDRVVGAATWLASQIPESIRNLLNIKSPSRVMHDLGLQAAQGLINGLLAGGNGVGGAAESLGKRLVNSLKSVLGNFLSQLTGGFGGGSSSGGGGIFGGTPPFNPNGGGSSSGGGFGSLWKFITGDRTGMTDAAGNVIVDGRGWFEKATGAGSLFASAGPAALVGLFMSSLTERTPWKAALKGGLVGLAVSLIRRNKLRRQEEKIRNQGILDAFEQLKQYDNIISDVRTLRIDAASGIAQGTSLGDSVRSQYLQMANSLKDKKTRTHALQDVSRIDAIITQKMAELRGVAEIAGAAAERNRRMLPEFAGGVFMSPSFMAFRRHNGMLGGTFTGRDTIPAMLSHGEMVLNPKQMAAIRANAGFDVFKTASIPGYANGGMAQSQPVDASPSVINLSVQMDRDGMFTASAQSPTGRKILLNLVEDGFANDDLKLKRR